MRRALVILLLLSLGLNAGLLWSRWQATRVDRVEMGPQHGPARGGGPGPPGRGWARHRVEALGRRMDLDAERRRLLDETLSELEPALTDARRSLWEARRELGGALREAEPDRQRILDLQREVSLRQAVLDSLVTEALLREAAVLRPEERMRSGRWFPRGRGDR